MMIMVPNILTAAAPYLFTLLAVVVYLYKPYWQVRKVPGPPLIPLIGHLHLLGKHGPDILKALAKQYGPIYRFHIGRQPLVIVADADLIREVGIKKFKIFRNRSIPVALSGSPMHDKSIFSTRDRRWSSMKSTVTVLTQQSHIAGHIPLMQSHMEAATADLSATPNIPLNKLLLKLFINLNAKIAYGVDFGLIGNEGEYIHNNYIGDGDDDGDNFIKQQVYAISSLKMDLSASLSIIVGLLFPVLQVPLRRILMRIPGTIDWKRERANRKLGRVTAALVEKRACDLHNRRTRGEKDFLSVIMEARESKRICSDIFTSDYISAVVYENIVGGSGPLTMNTTCLVYLVAKHPEVEKKLLREIDDCAPNDWIPNADDLAHKFPYVNQVIKEVTRFYTGSPLMAREASEEVEVGGHLLPKATWVWLAPGAPSKDPMNFPDPEEFRPERFDPNCEEEKRRHPYAHIPFGIGPRGCPGQNISMTEMKLLVIHLYRNYIFRHTAETQPDLEFEYGIVLNIKNDVKLKAIKRSRS